MKNYSGKYPLDVQQVKELDRAAKKIGFSERELIENASSNLFCIIESLRLGKKALVVSGRGNNGADVLSCARKMASRGMEVEIAVLEERPLKEEAFWQKRALEGCGIKINSIKKDNTRLLREMLNTCDFILEGIFGIGLKGKADAFSQEVIGIINSSGKKIISCDVPSGLSAQEGTIQGESIRADYTITFIGAKKGFFLNKGPKMCGEIFVADIGVSREILERIIDDG
ncbi:MAG: NAD(P)H-hydrate epimerase [Candidatus Omnitrophica bacterium]|nr:NAD(P)H-hydrate epimerase [Candidatus Omnitrophota bacterium]